MRKVGIAAAAVLIAVMIGDAARGQDVISFRIRLDFAVSGITDTLSIGVRGDGPGGTITDNTYELDPDPVIFGEWAESSLPPPPPGGITTMQARVVDIPGRPARLTKLRPRDYRGYSGVTTQVDTFGIEVDGNLVFAGGVTVSWPAGLDAYGTSWKLYLQDFITLQWNEVADMIATTSYAATTPGPAKKFLVIKEGVVTTTGVVEQRDGQVPTVYALEQNFPNPFNPTTTIWFDLPEARFVTISVHNILGQEITRLVDQDMAAGRHSVRFDATGLASGMYLYRMQAGALSLERRMMVLK